MFSVKRGSDGGQMEQGSALHRDPSSSASLPQRGLQPGTAVVSVMEVVLFMIGARGSADTLS